MTNMTYAVALDLAINAVADDAAKEKLIALKTQLAKRSAGAKKPTKTQKENEGLKEDIFAFIVETGEVRAGDVALHFGISGQKASALLKQLADGGRLVKTIEKRVSIFRISDEV